MRLKEMDPDAVKSTLSNLAFGNALAAAIIKRKGVATDRLVGFHDLGGKDDFPTRKLELFLLKNGMIEEKKRDEVDDDYLEGQRRSVRTSADNDSDSD